MSTPSISLPSAPTPLSVYFRNVSVAARGLATALFAVEEATAAAPAAAPREPRAATGVSHADSLSLYRLYCLASRASAHDSVSPAVVDELRRIADRA